MPADPQGPDHHWMAQALAQARSAALAGEVPVGAVAVADGQVLARAHNQVELLHDATAHAEMLCLTAASHALGSKFLPDLTLYVTLEPCVMCAGALRWARLGRLVFAAADEKFGYQRYGPTLLHPRTAVTGGVLAEEATALLKDFFQARR